MFDTLITLFNYDSNEDKYYPHLITDAEFQPKYKTEPNVTGTENDTSCLVILPYGNNDSHIYINDILSVSGTNYEYLPPKQWNETEDKEKYITLQTNIDFIFKGDFTETDTDFNLNAMKNKYDYVFVINEVKDFSNSLVSHFELTVN